MIEKTKWLSTTLRHTVLSHLAINGESIYMIKSISNHKSLQMLDRYVKLNPTIGKKPIEKLWK
jgi:integrase